MATQILTIHSETPEIRKIKIVADALQNGSVILYPTDTGFSLGCELSNKSAISKLRAIRHLPEHKSLTFLCDSLSNIAEFAKVTNKAYKTIKALIPGPYTFILPASKQVPKFAQNPKRKTSGIRVPENDLSQLLLKYVGQPIISITARMENEDYIKKPDELVDFFAPKVDLAVRSDNYHFVGESTVIDMTTDEFTIKRHGAGIGKVLEFVNFEED